MLEQILAGTISMPGMDMSAMKMDGDGDGEMHMEEDDDDAGHMGGNGIEIVYEGEFDREIKLTMAEWKFSKMQLDVKVGDRIK